MSRPKRIPVEDPLARVIKKFKKKILRLSKISGFSENQVIEDLMLKGAEETEELYLEIQAFRSGGETYESTKDHHEVDAPSVAQNGVGSDVFDTFPDPAEQAAEPDGAEAALNRLGDPELGRGLRPESEEVAESGHEPPAGDESPTLFDA